MAPALPIFNTVSFKEFPENLVFQDFDLLSLFLQPLILKSFL